MPCCYSCCWRVGPAFYLSRSAERGVASSCLFDSPAQSQERKAEQSNDRDCSQSSPPSCWIQNWRPASERGSSSVAAYYSTRQLDYACTSLSLSLSLPTFQSGERRRARVAIRACIAHGPRYGMVPGPSPPKTIRPFAHCTLSPAATSAQMITDGRRCGPAGVGRTRTCPYKRHLV